jgi:hypothetical protein
MRNHTLFVAVLAQLTPSSGQGRVQTPNGCTDCDYRQEHMRDGGHCYMFRNMPSPSCAQFRPIITGKPKE